jgi:hypothetical protein
MFQDKQSLLLAPNGLGGLYLALKDETILQHMFLLFSLKLTFIGKIGR